MCENLPKQIKISCFGLVCACFFKCDLARKDTYECVEDAFRYGKLVLATTTYNGAVFPTMREFIEHLIERNYQNLTIAFIENDSWAPAATKTITALFEAKQKHHDLRKQSDRKDCRNARHQGTE